MTSAPPIVSIRPTAPADHRATEEVARQAFWNLHGPVAVVPEFQRRGLGSRLIEATFEVARGLGHRVVVIYGNPTNDVELGFRGSKGFGVTDPNGRSPCALLVKELVPSPWEGRWRFVESEAFDAGFAPAEKGYHDKQEEFRILSRAFLE